MDDRKANILTQTEIERLDCEAFDACYYRDGEGAVVQRKGYRVVILERLQPFRITSSFSYDDVDVVFDLAAEQVRLSNRKGLRKGLTPTFVKVVFRNCAVDFIRQELPRRSRMVPLDVSVGDEADAELTLADVACAPAREQPEHRALTELLGQTIREVVADLPEMQRRALELRAVCDFEVTDVDPDAVNRILDETEGISYTAHTTAYADAKKGLVKGLAERLGGRDVLDSLLGDLDIGFAGGL
jgi:hypothetical protein